VALWHDSPEQRAVLGCIEALAAISNDHARPLLSPAVDAVIAATQAVFAARVRLATESSPNNQNEVRDV
jgi:hypothetical protein